MLAYGYVDMDVQPFIGFSQSLASWVALMSLATPVWDPRSRGLPSSGFQGELALSWDNRAMGGQRVCTICRGYEGREDSESSRLLLM